MNDSLRSYVSRETYEKLTAFARLVTKWTVKINLISKLSVPHLMERHIEDSAQIYTMAPSSGKWVDLGSGGGFPGIIVAILSQDAGNSHDVTLVESDQRKATFLRTAIRELDLNASVITARIEEHEPFEADILSARALADLNTLLEYTERHLKADGTALFLKGEMWPEEHVKAQVHWSYHLEAIKSETNNAAAVLRIKELVRV